MKILKKIHLILLITAALLSLTACATVSEESYPPIEARLWASSYQQAVLGVTASIYDDYAVYYSPEEFSVLLEDYYGTFAGVGIYISSEEEGITRVVGVMDDYPAQQAGMEIGDIIIEVDGNICAGLNSDIVASFLRGDPDSQVEVLVERAYDDGSSEQILLTITRAIIETISVEGQFLAAYPTIAYFNIYTFTENTPQEFADIFNDLEATGDIEGLILDLRNNSGGSFYAAMDIADFFVEDGEPIVWEKQINGEIEHISQDGSLQNLPVICLQNQGTASASEVLIGALRDHQVATLIGERTYGKGITQILEPLSDSSGIKYTASRYFTPSKYDLHQQGLEPDIKIEVDPDILYEEYFDPNNVNNQHMIAAIEVLSKELKLTTAAPITDTDNTDTEAD